MRVDIRSGAFNGRRSARGQAVLESAFSIHAAFDSDLRKSMGPEAISRMIKLNRNHKRYFNRIQRLITARYEAKFGRDVGAAKAAAAAGAPIAGK